jgi:hypothetical protein
LGLLIPEFEINLSEIKALQNEVIQNLLRIASKETGRPMSEFVVRDCFPKDDFGFTGCEWENQTAISAADTWTQDFTKTLPNDKFVCFYGVNYHKQATLPGTGAAEGYPYYGVAYKVGSAGGTVREKVHLQSAFVEYITGNMPSRSPKAFHKPVYYRGSETIRVDLIANATVTQYAENLELLCLVCEPFGNVISGARRDLMPEQTSVLMPIDEMSLTDIRGLREYTKRKLIELAAMELKRPADSFVVRDIFPLDDLAQNDTPTAWNGVEWQNQAAINTADTWESDWYHTLDKDEFLAFYGVKHPSGVSGNDAYPFKGVSYRLGSGAGSTLKQVHLQKCERDLLTTSGVQKAAIGYHQPVFYKGTDTPNIYLIANATVTQYYQQLQLLGLFCEPYGPAISGEQVI